MNSGYCAALQCSACFSVTHTKCAQVLFSTQVCLVASEAACRNIMWIYTLFLLNLHQAVGKASVSFSSFSFFFFFDQAVSYCLELICLKYYLPLILSYISLNPPINLKKKAKF